MQVNEYIVLIALAGAILCFVKEWLRVDLVALLVLAVLITSGVLPVDLAFKAAFDPAVFVVACMFVLSRALLKTGVADLIGYRLANVSGNNELKLTVVVCFAIALLSMFVNNTAIIAIFLPIVASVCRKHRINPSRVLMPMAFASLLGGVVTLVGTSTNLVVQGVSNEILRGHQEVELTMFSFAPAGLVIGLLGMFYISTVMRRFLTKRTNDDDIFEDYNVKEFISEVLVGAGSDVTGKSIVDLGFGERYDVTVVGIVREGNPTFAPAPSFVVREGDVLMVQGGVQDILDLRRQNRLQIKDEVRVQDNILRSLDVIMAEAVIAPGAGLIGRTLKDISFRDSYGLTVLAIHRRGLSITSHLANLELHLGDTLLIQGHMGSIQRLRRNEDFIVLEEIPSHKIGPTQWPIATLIMVGMVAATVSGLPVTASVLIACLLMVLTRCITMEDAYDSIDWRIILLLVGLLPLGMAIKESGLAMRVTGLFGPWSDNPLIMLAVVYLITNALTQVVAKAAAAIMVPIAINIAQQLPNEPIKPFLLAVAFASSFAFMSPIGHQCCALVMGPGKYRFADYFKAGFLLCLLMFFATVGILYWFYL